MTAPRAAVIADAMVRLSEINPDGETELMPSGDPLTFPAYHLFDYGHRADQSEPNFTRYGMDLGLEGYVAAEGGAEAYAELTTLYTRAVTALLADPPLGGVAETVDEGDMNIVVATLSEQRRLGFTLTIPVTFPARRGDPSKPA